MIVESDKDIADLLRTARRIAIVGLSDKPWRASHGVAVYLQAAGYEIIPVNPRLRSVLGRSCYPTLADVPPGAIDIVDVFRRPEELAPIVDDAIAMGARCLWLQLDVINEAEIARASAAGLQLVVDRCTKIEHARLARS